MSKKEEKAQEQTPEEAPLQQLMLNTKIEKYKLIPIAMRWVRELEKREENKGLTQAQILDLALKDILTGTISMEEISKLPPLPPKKLMSTKNEKRKK